ncbi:hypothetical protein ACH4OW_16185 [Streptomyces sp. NPDC017056]
MGIDAEPEVVVLVAVDVAEFDASLLSANDTCAVLGAALFPVAVLYGFGG